MRKATTSFAARPPGPRGPGRGVRAVAAGVCCLSLFMIAVDTTVVNLALPLIGRALHAQVAGLQWTIAAYTIATASLMLTSGSVGDRFGRRTVIRAGLAVFTAASLGCALAPGIGWLIAFRAIQGAAGSALTPMAMGIITAMFADPAPRARVLGLWAGTFGVGMAAGPVIGGVLAAAWGWRSLFWINVLPGLAGLALAGLIPNSRAARPRRLDPPGQVLVIAFLACLTYGVIQGPLAGWRSAAIVGMFAAAALALAALIAWELRRADPLIDPRLFRSVPFSGALLITVSSFAALGGFLFLSTMYLQDARSLSTLRAGVALLPLAVATTLAGPLAGRVFARYGGRWLLTVAGTTLAAGCFALAQSAATAPWALLAVVYAVFGAGYGMVNAVISAVAIEGLPRDQAGIAGGLTSAGRQAGQSLGVAVAGSILAVGLDATTGHRFTTAAAHPAWLVLAAAGLAVMLLGLTTTARGAAPPPAPSRGTAARDWLRSARPPSKIG